MSNKNEPAGLGRGYKKGDSETTKTASLDHYDIEEEAARKLKPKMK